ncbi:phenylalanine--tRNA ligase subunit beta [Candidatus Woesearchaeota archaeon]|nr:phenylalanine--tRNA ligase subunit beta [Candidatus Woesearchaeota archaeon]MBW3022022.1 phenylalanine--tRNA ligase subunit beta [Candidatus Woesearchaeota archaeon]
MPTVTLNKKIFEQLVGKKLPLDKLKDRISMLGTDLDKIEGNEIIVEVFPNRPDMLSEQGFARAFSSFIGVKTGLRKYDVKKSGYNLIVEKSLPKQWPYAFACIVKGLKFDDEKIREVIQIQEKLAMTMLRKRKKGGIGLYPLEKITFPVRFTGMDPDKIKFRPLEYPKEITGRQILSKHPTGRTYGHLCEGWTKYPVFVDSKGIIMSMPPIINSHDVGKIDETTKDVFIEVTGTDPIICQKALTIIVTALSDMGGTIYSIECMQQDGKRLDIPMLAPEKWDIEPKFVNKMLGLELKEQDMKKLLEKMGYGYEKGKVLVPAYRADIMHQVDFVEDIAIAYGFEKFVPEIPNVSTIGEEDKFEIFKRYIAEILSGLNLLECETYNITNPDNLNKKMNNDSKYIKLSNALTADYSVLRSWILPNLMQVFQENKHYEYPQNIFGIGTVFKENSKTETGVEEFTRVAVALCGMDSDYTKIRQVFDYLMQCLDMKSQFASEDHPSFITGRCVRVKSEGKGIAYMGEVSPEVLRNWDLDMPVAAFELNLTELFNIINK